MIIVNDPCDKVFKTLGAFFLRQQLSGLFCPTIRVLLMSIRFIFYGGIIAFMLKNLGVISTLHRYMI